MARTLPGALLAVLLLARIAPATAQNASWTALPGPSGGAATGVASRLTPSGQTAVAATPDSLYWTDDSGRSWRTAPAPRGPSATTGALVGTPGGFWALGAPLLRLIGGEVWQDASAGLPPGGARGVALTSVSPAYVAATEAGVFRLDPGSTAWRPTLLTQPVSSVVSLTDANGFPNGTVLAGLATTGIGSDTYSVARSDDGGATWEVVPVGTYREAEITGLAVLPDGSILAGGSPTSDTGRAASPHRSADAGQTWSRVVGLPEGLVITGAFAAGPVAAVTGFSPESYVSTDAGQTWRTVPLTITGLAEGAAGSVLVATARRGIVRTDAEARAFADATDGVGRADVGHVAVYRDLVLAARRADFSFGTGLYRSADLGDTWTRIDVGFDARGLSDVHIDPAGRAFAAPDRCFGDACAASGVYRSLDGGLTWAPTPLVFSSVTTAVRLFDGPGGALWALANTRALYRSLDGGASWEPRTAPPYSRTFAAGPDGALWAGSDRPGVSVARSTDDGVTWTEVLVRASGTRTSALVVAGDGSVIVGASGFGYRSTDGGETWARIDFGGATPGYEVDVLRLRPDGALFASAGAPVLRSLDNGQTWAAITDGLPEARLAADLALQDDGALWAALGAGGLYRRPASAPVADAPAADGVPFALDIAPNPSRGRASVTVTGALGVRVSVHDALGRRVALLHDGPAASALVLPIPEALPAGVYVVRASKGERVASKRFVVVR